MANLFKMEYGKVTAFVGKLAESGLTDELVETVLKNPDLADRMVEAILTTKGSETVYRLTIDRAMSLTDLIALGKYDWVNDDITPEHFPLDRKDGETGTEEREVVLIHLDEYLTTDQVKVELDRRDLKPASIVELLTLGAAHPDLQREYPIVALGSTWRDPGGDRGVPELWNGHSERRLGLNYADPDGEWDEYYRFVALRK